MQISGTHSPLSIFLSESISLKRPTLLCRFASDINKPVPDGWQKHSHPDGYLYYSNPSKGWITDEEIRDEPTLAEVEDIGSHYCWLPVAEGVEAFITFDRDERAYFVNHMTRMLSKEVNNVYGDSAKTVSRKDRKWFRYSSSLFAKQLTGLYYECDYWEFMKKHPSHRPLPEGAEDDALEILEWCYGGLVFLCSRVKSIADLPFKLASLIKEGSTPLSQEESRRLLKFIPTLSSKMVLSLSNVRGVSYYLTAVKHEQ
jgi:hypothetical protein